MNIQPANSVRGSQSLKNQEDGKDQYNQEELNKIISIQSFIRRWSAQLAAEKEKANFLDFSIFEKVKPYTEDANKLKELHMTIGRTPVYLHDEFVIKQSGHPDNQKRFTKMREAREIIDKNQYSCLVIPTARTHKDCVIESRLPIITGINRKEQIGFYLDHINEFTKAVEEFTGFLCQCTLEDITGNIKDPYTIFCKDEIGRYENVAMYLEEKEGKISGKIGLIDLEEFDPKPTYYILACQDAVRLFPHHLETIINAATKLGFEITDVDRKSLEATRDKQLEYFKKAYVDHLNFVKDKDIDLKDPLKLIEISTGRKEEIWEVLEAMLRNANKDNKFLNLFGESEEDVDENLKSFKEKTFPEIINSIQNEFLNELLTKTFRENSNRNGGRWTPKDPAEITSYPKLISSRTFEFESRNFFYEYLKQSIEKKLGNFKFKSKYAKDDFIEKIINNILFELEKGKEIAYYNPSFVVGSYANNSCVFC